MGPVESQGYTMELTAQLGPAAEPLLALGLSGLLSLHVASKRTRAGFHVWAYASSNPSMSVDQVPSSE